MTSKSLQSFDVTAHIRDEVRKVLVASIPDEQMDAMIEKEVDSFFAPSKSTYGGDGPSRFSRVVERAVEERVKESLKKWMSENFGTEWSKYGGPAALTATMVEEFIPIAQAKMVADMTQNALLNIQNQLRVL